MYANIFFHNSPSCLNNQCNPCNATSHNNNNSHGNPTSPENDVTAGNPRNPTIPNFHNIISNQNCQSTFCSPNSYGSPITPNSFNRSW